MNRFFATMQLDLRLQWRNRLYTIGILLSLLFGLAIAGGLARDQRAVALPIYYLFALGGTSMLYVIALLIFEKDEGTLNAQRVAPLSLHEYLLAKLATLTLLALVESVVVLLIAWGPGGFQPLALFAGIALMSVMLTLMGIILVVRYDSLTDALLPLAALLVVLQLPFLYVLNVVPSPLLLLIPTSAPTLLIWSAWHPIELWQVAYALVYALALVVGLYLWAVRAYRRHITLK